MLEEGISALPEVMQVRGLELLNDMKSQAERLDLVRDPTAIDPNSLGDSLAQYRDEFQASCKNMNNWAKTHLPDLNFD